MTVARRPIPLLPDRPRARPFAHNITRSYPTGRQRYSRALAGRPFALTVSAEGGFGENVRAMLDTNIDAACDDWAAIPFVRAADGTFVCIVTPSQPGLFAFRARYSLDSGATWHPDVVPDAWVVVDPPQVDDLRMYTMIPTVSGSIADWTADLPRIQSMGFNAIHLLPVTPMDASESPYSAHELFDIDHAYLTDGARVDGLGQLEAFVETAHALGIRLCFDLVLNHVGIKSRMVQRAPDWIVPDQDSPDGLRRARYWFDQEWHVWSDLALINYEHPSEATRAELREYMTQYALFWGGYANYTHGFVRFDNLHSSHKEFVGDLTARMRDVYPNLGIIAEYFTDEATLVDTVPIWGLNLVLATPWNLKFVPQLRDYLKYVHHISTQIRYFMPVNSHDSGSVAEEFGNTESTVPRYVASALMGTGATGITQGVEWGSEEKIGFMGRHQRLVPPDNPRFAEFLRDINGIIADHPTFRTGGNCEFVDNDHAAIIAAYRRGAEPDAPGFLVLCNFDIYNSEWFEADLGKVIGAGPLAFRDLLSGECLRFPTAAVRLQLPPSSARILAFATGQESD